MKLFALKELTYWGNKKADDGSYRCSELDCGVYSSLKRAKETMYSLIGDKVSSERLGFWIFERVIDEGKVGPFDGFCLYDSVRAYYADGRLMCYSPYDEACRREFRGRDPGSVPVKNGELAWWADGGSITPVLVGAGPVTKARWQDMARRAKERGDGYGKGRKTGLDYSDDCYYVYEYDKGHGHPPIWCLFPYFGKISKRNMGRLLKTKKWYDDGCPGA